MAKYNRIEVDFNDRNAMGWKIYFWIFVILVLWGYSGVFSENVTVYDYVDVPISIIGLTGFFGFAFKKRFLSPGFWKIWLFITFIWDIFYNYYLSAVKTDVNYFDAPLSITIIAFILTISAPF